MKLGTAIKTIRIKNGLKQFELAQQCDITQTYLSQIENNLKEPNISTLKQIATHLNIPLPILFFLSIEETDINPVKRKAFKMIDGPIKSMINEFFHIHNLDLND
jgi:transcriptional regulator with XRE-family HTH domain